MENTKTESYKEKLIQLFLEQKRTLDLFLERNAISKAQYDKSLGDLKVKMKIVKKREESTDARYGWRLRLGEREPSAGSSQGACRGR